MEKKPNLYPLILLAAGKSSRMGEPKGLVSFHGRPWILEQLDRYKQAGGTKAIVVLGFHQEAYHKELDRRSEVTILMNSEPQRGQFSSVQIAAQYAHREGFPACFLLPVDVAAPSPQTWAQLQQAFEPEAICVPCLKGTGGHPVLLNAHFMESILLSHASDRLDNAIKAWGNTIRGGVDDARIRTNLNTADRFRNFVKASEGRNGCELA